MREIDGGRRLGIEVWVYGQSNRKYQHFVKILIQNPGSQLTRTLQSMLLILRLPESSKIAEL
jgi:hypothetical protein